ncbi:hypothetical protein KKF17_03550 [Patescibacteria group bacterium]|nr:hypothetical protein [Patescibacteria group bacterium]
MATCVFKRDDEIDATLKIKGNSYSVVKGVVEIANEKDANFLKKCNPIYKPIETKD